MAEPLKFLTEDEIKSVQDRFLLCRAELGDDRSAYKESHVSRTTVHKWKELDTYGFKARYKDACEEYAELLERFLHDHIMQLKPGQNILALIFRLKAEKPEKYRELPNKASEGAFELVRALTEVKGPPKEEVKPDKKGDEGTNLSPEEQIERILKGEDE